MNKLLVRGHSDDVLCIEGDLTDEFYPPGNKPGYLAFSEGTLLSVQYTDGFWRINRLQAGAAAFTKVEATDPDDEYSDHVTLEGNFTWVLFGERLERIKSKVKDC